MDKSQSLELLDDGGGDWELARIIPPQIAKRYGYGSDPKLPPCPECGARNSMYVNDKQRQCTDCRTFYEDPR
jgi:hypothetical protein